MVASLITALQEGESHTTEFKETTSLLREAAQTIVAFANANGGDLFFGVTNKKDVKGIQIGAQTLEKLVPDLEQFIYPYAPIAIDPIMAFNGKEVIRVSVQADTPPVVGLYFYSSAPLSLDQRVLVKQLHAYRRVGRRNRAVPDFRWLRPQSAMDPLVLMDVVSHKKGDVLPTTFDGHVWLAANTGLAHDVRIRLEPEIAPPKFVVRLMPVAGFSTQRFQFSPPHRAEPLEGFSIIVEYCDDWGCLWESRRWVAVREGEISPAATLSRRIVELPPKRATA